METKYKVLIGIVLLVIAILLFYFLYWKPKKELEAKNAAANTAKAADTTTPTNTTTTPNTTTNPTNTTTSPANTSPVIAVPAQLNVFAESLDGLSLMGILGTTNGLVEFEKSTGVVNIRPPQTQFEGYYNNDLQKPITRYNFSLAKQYKFVPGQNIFNLRDAYKFKFMQNFEDANKVYVSPPITN